MIWMHEFLSICDMLFEKEEGGFFLLDLVKMLVGLHESLHDLQRKRDA